MTVLTNTVFQQSYRRQVAHLSPNNFNMYAGGAGGANRDAFLPLIEGELNAMDRFLKGLRTDGRFTIGGGGAQFTRLTNQGKGTSYNVVKDAFKDEPRREMVGTYASFLAPFIASFTAKSEINHAAPNPAPDWAYKPRVKVAYDALAVNTMVKQAVLRRTRFFRTNIETLCQRLVDDWDDINDLFFPNLVLKKLVGIGITGGDFHKEGKQVLILTFKAQAPRVTTRHGHRRFGYNTHTRPTSQIVRLIYKPSDVELDYRLVGDSDAVHANVNHLTAPHLTPDRQLSPAHSLFAAINREVLAHPIPLARPLHLPTYRILPRNAGSRLATVADPGGGPPILPIARSYGYIEFLPFEPEAGGTANNPTVALDMAHPGDWCYVTQRQDQAPGQVALQEYYRIFGWYMAMGLILNFGDQHTENLRVHNRRPKLIDMEIIFKHRATEIQATMLQYHFGHTPQGHVLDCLNNENVLLCHDQNGVIQHTMGPSASVQMVAGFDEAMTWIGANPNIFNTWLNEGSMGDVVARYTPKATATYKANMMGCFELDHIDQPMPNPANRATYMARTCFSKLYWEAICKWHEHGGRTFHGRPSFAIEEPDHDWACYLNTDAPAYYRRLGENELRNARGKIVRVIDPGGKAGIADFTLEAPGDPRTNGIAELVLPAAAGPEHIKIEAYADRPGNNNVPHKQGDAGLRMSLEILDNPGGAGAAAHAMVINVVNRNWGAPPVMTPHDDIVVTLGRTAHGANMPITLAELNTLINANGAITVSASLVPGGAAGNTQLNAMARETFWAPHPILVAPGIHYFDYDAEAVAPALRPLQIALERVSDIQNNNNARVQTNCAGANAQGQLDFGQVVTQFRNYTTNQVVAIPGTNPVAF